MKETRILIFPCGSEVALELHSALKDVPFITLIGASSVADHGKYVFHNYIEGLPYITDPAFIESFNELLVREHIDYIYPAMDQVIDVLSENREKLSAQLIAPNHDAVHICRSKERTYERLAGLDFVPMVYTGAAEVSIYPVIIKPAEGYGAKGFRILHSRQELENALAETDEKMVICEYLPGEEYTIDCFTDRHGLLRYVSCRNRNRVRGGISVNSRLQPHDEKIRTIAEEISSRIAMRGAWFFQLKRNAAGEYKLLEAATRVAGTMCLERAVGVNLPLLTVYDMLGYDVEIMPQFETVEVDRALYSAFSLPRAFSEVYVDFDDTLTVRGKVNDLLMCYLYQCVNAEIPITLISKHDGDLLADMRKLRIMPELFDEVIQIPREARKSDFIRPSANALFIDDSCAERKQMQEKWHTTVLSVDAVECLIDYRR